MRRWPRSTSYLAVQRLHDHVDVTRLDERAWHFAGALFVGRPLGAALAALAGIDAPALLAQHLSAGRFVAFRIAASETAP